MTAIVALDAPIRLCPPSPASANNVQPSPRRILFCPITSISERTGADVIEFHQVANFALFSTLRQPFPGTASSTQSRCPLRAFASRKFSVLCLTRNNSCTNFVRVNNTDLSQFLYATYAEITQDRSFTHAR